MGTCNNCFLEGFKRANEKISFKDDIKQLEIKLDVLFIKHFGHLLIERTPKDPLGIDRLASMLSGQGMAQARELQSQMMNDRRSPFLHGTGQRVQSAATSGLGHFIGGAF